MDIALRRAVRRLEEEIAEQGFETAAAFQANGALLLKKSGQRAEVRFAREEAIRMLEAAVFTHNHPRNTSFSLADVDLAWRLLIGEIRVISPRYHYSLQPPVGGWRSVTWKAIEEIVNTTYMQVKQEFEEQIAKGQISGEEADMLHWHTVWTRVAPQVGFSYRRRKR